MTISLLLGALMWLAGFKMVSCYLDVTPVRPAVTTYDNDTEDAG